MKNMTKKQKKIAAVTVAGIVLTGGVIGAVATMDNGYDTALSAEQIEEKQRELNLTLDFMETPKEEYKIKSDDEEFTIVIADVIPEIDTSEIGTTKHELEINDETFKLIVNIQDSREISLAEFTELTVETEFTQEDLETKIGKNLTPEDLDEGDELEFTFSYPEEFDLKTEGEHIVEVKASFANNTSNSLKRPITIYIEAPKAVEQFNSESNDTEINEETNSSSHSSSSGSSNTGNSELSSSNESTSNPSTPPINSDEDVEEASYGDNQEPDPKPSEPIEPTPSDPTVSVPSNLPNGASYIDGDSTGHNLAYSGSLPGGGSITRVTMDFLGKRAMFMGIDNAGVVYGATVNRENLAYMGNYPTLTDADADLLRELGSQFLNAYGF